MPAYFLGLRDFWGQWSIDERGVEHGRYGLDDLVQMMQQGVITPRTWLRHVWTRRYALAGEILFQHGKVTEDEFDVWFPAPKAA